MEKGCIDRLISVIEESGEGELENKILEEFSGDGLHQLLERIKSETQDILYGKVCECYVFTQICERVGTDKAIELDRVLWQIYDMYMLIR